MNDINEKVKDKPLVSYNDKGFMLNYSVTRNEEIAFIDYEQKTITFKQMPLPIDKIKDILSYYEDNKKDHEKYLAREKKDENSEVKDSQ